MQSLTVADFKKLINSTRDLLNTLIFFFGSIFHFAIFLGRSNLLRTKFLGDRIKIYTEINLQLLTFKSKCKKENDLVGKR